MENLGLTEFFDLVDYNWNVDHEKIKNVCFYTKSRVNNDKPSSDFSLAYGMEQPFVLKAIADKMECNAFFEIGTGRGTGSYAVSFCKSVKEIATLDVVPFTQKRNEAVGYDPAHVSNADLYAMLNIPEKNKIEFYERKDFGEILKNKPAGGYDLLFIDGNHTDFNVIAEDFLMCQLLSHDKSVIVWDDYYPDKFAIREVLTVVLEKNPGYKALLLSSRGHLFGNKTPEVGSGMVVMMKSGAYENFLS